MFRLLTVAGLLFATATQGMAGPAPSGSEVTGLSRGHPVNDAIVEYDCGTWNIKTGRSQSSIVTRNFSGDITAVARIDDAGGRPIAHIGLMIWSSLSQTAGKAGLVVDPQGQKISFSWDESSDRPQMYTNFLHAEGIGFPVWLKLARTGGHFTPRTATTGASG